MTLPDNLLMYCVLTKCRIRSRFEMRCLDMNRISLSYVSCIACMWGLLSSHAQPANDNFAASWSLAGIVVTTNGSSLGGTRESFEGSYGFNVGGRSVWFTWIAPNSNTFEVNTFGSAFDTVLAVFEGIELGGLALVAAN